MSYSITVNGQTQTIEACYNEDFTKSVEIFRCFDDSRINSIDNILSLGKMDRDFKIRFYLGGTIECFF